AHNIMSILSPDCLGTRQEFLREWGAAEHNGKITVTDPAALGTYLREAGLMLRRTRTDVHRELPQPLRIRQPVDADPAALDHFSGDVIAMAHLVLDTAADQQQRWTAAGNLDWRLRHATGVAKAPYVAAFVHMLLESEQRLVLFGWHRAVYDIWRCHLTKHRPVLYTGTETPRHKQLAAEQFIQGDSRVLIMSLRAGAGLDGLQHAASMAVFGELDWSPGVHDQCIGRFARDGQDATVAAYFLVSDHGADPVMDEVLQLKRMQAEPMRDPTMPLLAPAATNTERITLLARAVLDRAAEQEHSRVPGRTGPPAKTCRGAGEGDGLATTPLSLTTAPPPTAGQPASGHGHSGSPSPAVGARAYVDRATVQGYA
ncbi:MAG: hypothetical protein ACRDSN_12605, partial [Pseudonocardiaceae bacterium]